MQTPNLLTVKLFAAKHASFTAGSLRNLIFFSQINGFDKCIVRVGRKVLIDEEEFFKWIKGI